MTDEIAVREVMARYVRAADQRNGAAMAALFVEGATVEIHYDKGGADQLLGVLEGREAIANAVSAMMRPHPPLGWSHHTTHDALVSIDGDVAELDTQFVVFNVLGAEEPAEGWPATAAGAQGAITPIESGYYRPTLQKRDGAWLIQTHRIYHDLPMAFPRQAD